MKEILELSHVTSASRKKICDYFFQKLFTSVQALATIKQCFHWNSQFTSLLLYFSEVKNIKVILKAKSAVSRPVRMCLNQAGYIAINDDDDADDDDDNNNNNLEQRTTHSTQGFACETSCLANRKFTFPTGVGIWPHGGEPCNQRQGSTYYSSTTDHSLLARFWMRQCIGLKAKANTTLVSVKPCAVYAIFNSIMTSNNITYRQLKTLETSEVAVSYLEQCLFAS